MARLKLRPLATLFLVARPLLAEPPAAPPPADAPPADAPPASDQPADAPPAQAPAAPAPPPAPHTAAPPQPAPPRLDSALVHLAADYPGVVLELRSYADSGDWKVACSVPCDRTLVTLGAEARVSAPG